MVSGPHEHVVFRRHGRAHPAVLARLRGDLPARKGHVAAGRVLGPLRRGVIVLAVYATGIGAGSFLGFLILLGTVFAGAGYMVALPRLFRQLHRL